MLLFFVILIAFAVRPAAAAQTACGSAPAPRLVIGEQGRVLPGDPNNVRDQPSANGARIGALPGGSAFTVLEGPVCADGFNWWRVEGEGVTGWTVEGADGAYWIEPMPEELPPELELIRGTCPFTTDRIAVSTIRREVTASGTNLYGQLITLNRDGGDACLLTEMSGEPTFLNEMITQIVWSPDGTQIAFRMAANRYDQRIYLINADGTNLRPLTTVEDKYSHAVWSPDGEQIAFLRDDGVWVGYADGRGSQEITDTGSEATALAWSPDGTWLAFAVTGAAEPRIYLLSPNGGDPQLIAETTIYPITDIAWTRDSAMLEISAPGMGIYRIITTAALEQPVTITFNEQDNRMSPVWNSDGTWLAHWIALGSLSDAHVALALLSADGGTERTLVDSVQNELRTHFLRTYPPSWSPDGQFLVYAESEGVSIVDVNSGEITRIWDGVPNSAPQFQP